MLINCCQQFDSLILPHHAGDALRLIACAHLSSLPCLLPSQFSGPPDLAAPSERTSFYEDHGFPNQSHDFNVILQNIDGDCILRKRKHPAPSLDDCNPCLASEFCKPKHGAKLRSDINLSHLDEQVRAKVYDLTQKYWSVFADEGQFVPVKDYQCQCVIDTGSARSTLRKVKSTTVPKRCQS